MHIIFNPPENKENKYIEILVRSLREDGYQVHALDDFFSGSSHFQSIKLVHLNWFENVDDSSFYLALRSFIRKMFVLSIIRVSKKKLVWTMHNRMSHEKRTGFFSRIITRFLIRWSHKVIIHSELSRSILTRQYAKAAGKIFYLPHPDFIGVYGPLKEDRNKTADTRPLALLFMGAVKPYKNIELLIKAVRAFKEEVFLTIAGKPSTPAYEKEIAQLASSAGNVNPVLKFVPDGEISQLLQEADLLVLPYDLNSSLNSGTVILGFSYGKTVICPEIGTIADLGSNKSGVLYYRYGSEQEHLSMLMEQIGQAVQMKKTDPSVFIQMGGRMYDHVRKVHNKELVGARLIHLYKSLLD